MEFSIGNEFDYHAHVMKQIGIDLGDEINEEKNLLIYFKQKIMPAVKKLREVIEKYEDSKIRSIDVARAFEQLFNVCKRVCRHNPIICEYLKLNRLLNSLGDL